MRPGRPKAPLADFQDLLLRARDVLVGSVPVRRYFQAKFDRILVDEFQDTDPLQAEIVALLAEDPATPPAADWRQVRAPPRQALHRRRPEAVHLPVPARRPPGLRGRQDAGPPVRRRCPAADGELPDRAVRDCVRERSVPRDLRRSRAIQSRSPCSRTGTRWTRKAARTVALTVPPEQVPEDTRIDAQARGRRRDDRGVHRRHHAGEAVGRLRPEHQATRGPRGRGTWPSSCGR